MEPIFYGQSEYIVTQSSRNIVSTQLHLYAPEAVHVGDRTVLDHGCIIRGDLTGIEIGESCIIGKQTIIRPSGRQLRDGSYHFLPIKIGDKVVMEEGVIMRGLSVGDNCIIGSKAVVSSQCIISECCKILPGTVLIPGTIVPPFSVWGGSPGHLVEVLSEDFPEKMAYFIQQYYDRYQPNQ